MSNIDCRSMPYFDVYPVTMFHISGSFKKRGGLREDFHSCIVCMPALYPQMPTMRALPAVYMFNNGKGGLSILSYYIKYSSLAAVLYSEGCSSIFTWELRSLALCNSFHHNPSQSLLPLQYTLPAQGFLTKDQTCETTKLLDQIMK